MIEKSSEAGRGLSPVVSFCLVALERPLLAEKEKGGLGEVMILNLLYRKDIKIFLDFPFFPGQ